MKNKGKLAWFLRAAVLLSIVMLYVGCGGGGGGGGSSDNYTGSRSQAAITDGNAEVIMLGAYVGSQVGRNTGGMSAQVGISSGGPSLPITYILNKSIKDIYDKGGLTFKSPTKASEEDETYPGDCGGSVSIVETSSTTGDLIYDNYCVMGITLDGTVHATLISDTDTATELSLNYANCTLTANCFSIKEDGRVVIRMTDSNIRATYSSFCLTNNGTGKTSMVDDYVVTIYSDYMTVSGRFYYPDYGYVTISTESTVYFDSGGAYDGVLLATGSDGSKSTITFSDGYYYSIDVDDNGDGTFETIVEDYVLGGDC